MPGTTTKQELEKQIADLEKKISNMYLSRHYKSVTAKIGEIQNTVNHSSMAVKGCYAVNFFMIIVCMIFVGVAGLFLYKKMYELHIGFVRQVPSMIRKSRPRYVPRSRLFVPLNTEKEIIHSAPEM